MRLIKNWRVADATRTPIWEGSGIAALLVTELKVVSQALRREKASPPETIRAVRVAVSA